MIARNRVTGVLLCGGEGKRFGGLEKPLEGFGGESMFAQLRERLAPQVERIVVSANRRLDEYRRFGDVVVPDIQPGLGPLGGLASALAAVSTEFAFSCPGDAPHLSTTLVARLAIAMERPDVDVVVPHDGERLQPLFLLMRTSCLPDLQAFLEADGRAAHQWLETQRVATVDLSAERDSFVNVNSAADLVALLAHPRAAVAGDAESSPAVESK